MSSRDTYDVDLDRSEADFNFRRFRRARIPVNRDLSPHTGAFFNNGGTEDFKTWLALGPYYAHLWAKDGGSLANAV